MNNKAVKKAEKKNKYNSIIFTIIFSIAFWLLLIGKPFVFLHSHDTLYAVLYVIQYTVAICVVYCFIKSLVFIKSQRAQSRSSHAMLKISGLIVILACSLFLWTLLEVEGGDLQTVGHFSIDKKYDKGGKHYISISNGDVHTDISVDKETYDALIVDRNVSYNMEYRTIRLSSKGVLEKAIDINSFTDNRE